MKKRVLFLFTVICISFFIQNIYAQTNNYVDIVYLNNGSIIKGVIIENTPNVAVKLKTADGSVFVYAYSDILKFAKEEIIIKELKLASNNQKSPGIALLCSFLLPGGGQYYNGEIIKGVAMTTVWVGSSVGLLVGDGFDDELKTLLCLGAISLTGIVSMADALVSANRINRRNSIGLLNLKIGNDMNLSLIPDVQLRNNYSRFASTGKSETTIGLKLRLTL